MKQHTLFEVPINIPGLSYLSEYIIQEQETWKHGIAARKSDNGIMRKRRISLTFRKVILNPL